MPLKRNVTCPYSKEPIYTHLRTPQPEQKNIKSGGGDREKGNNLLPRNYHCSLFKYFGNFLWHSEVIPNVHPFSF
ncbi:Uncharacterized protein TCM_015417 [Theobroma cacao]|uniref:Uncharacterized protein n=1 Tax=Theobroma cacao TaxID=3641 RepID=A0A061G1V3_THECC|nr:Uncharacterized protein TCM_015417 [Theobroma cacao]